MTPIASIWRVLHSNGVRYHSIVPRPRFARSGNRVRLALSCWVLALASNRALAFDGVYDEDELRELLPYAMPFKHTSIVAWVGHAMGVGVCCLSRLHALPTVAKPGVFTQPSTPVLPQIPVYGAKASTTRRTRRRTSSPSACRQR